MDERFKNGAWKYFSVFQKISTLQRMILVHSFLYYEKDVSVVTDKKYDETARYLVKLQKTVSKEQLKTKTDYGYAFYDFDGFTGFDLYYRLTDADKFWIEIIANNVLGVYNQGVV